MKRISSVFFSLGFVALAAAGLSASANTYPAQALPRITSMSPASGAPGTIVTLKGSGFERDSATHTGVVISLGHYGPILSLSTLATANGQIVDDETITFSMPASIDTECSSHTAPCQHTVIAGGTYGVKVNNGWGVSNSAQFTLVTPSSVVLTFPLGGEAWQVGSRATARWKYSKVENIKSVTLNFLNSSGAVAASGSVAPYTTQIDSVTGLSSLVTVVSKSITVPALADGNYSLEIHVITKKGTDPEVAYDSVSASPVSISNLIKGAFDSATCSAENSLSGWVCDPAVPGTPLKVSFYDETGSLVQSSLLSANSRPDVASLCGGNANHGFAIALAPRVRDGAMHTLSAFAVDSKGTRRPFGTQAIQCAPGSSTSVSTRPIIVLNASGDAIIWTINSTPGITFGTNVASGAVTATLKNGAAVYTVGAVDASAKGAVLSLASVPAGKYTFQLALSYGGRDYHTVPVRITINDPSYVQKPSISLNYDRTVPLRWQKGTAPAISFTSNVPSGTADVVLQSATQSYNIATHILVPGSTAAVDLTGIPPGSYSLKLVLYYNAKIYNSSSARVTVVGMPTVLGGIIDTISCTGVSGWACDGNKTVSVQLRDESGNLISTKKASGTRADVVTAGNCATQDVKSDNTLFGFTFALPAKYKNGQPHTFVVNATDKSAAGVAQSVALAYFQTNLPITCSK